MLWHTCLIALGLLGAGESQPPTPRDNPIFPPEAKLERLFERSVDAKGGLTEGPALAPDGSIYFTDILEGPTTQTRIERFDPKTGRVELFTDKAGKANGLAFDREGLMLACDGSDGGGRCLARWNVKTGARAILVDRYQGHRFNSPNDLSIDAKGRIYFTDPFYGGQEKRELPKQSIYRFDPDGKLSLVTDQVEKPNGIVLSPDERTLYVGDHNNAGHGPTPSDRLDGGPGAMTVLAFDLDDDGLVQGGPRTLVDFKPENGCDGITVDAVGNLYLTCRSLAKPGISVLDPQGHEVAFLPTGPAGQSGAQADDWQGIPSNVEFGLDDGSGAPLYITIDKGFYRVATRQHGVRPRWAGADGGKK